MTQHPEIVDELAEGVMDVDRIHDLLAAMLVHRGRANQVRPV